MTRSYAFDQYVGEEALALALALDGGNFLRVTLAQPEDCAPAKGAWYRALLNKGLHKQFTLRIATDATPPHLLIVRKGGVALSSSAKVEKWSPKALILSEQLRTLREQTGATPKEILDGLAAPADRAALEEALLILGWPSPSPSAGDGQ